MTTNSLLRKLLSPAQRRRLKRELDLLDAKLSSPGALQDVEGRRYAESLEKNLSSYFQRLAYDTDKIEWKDTYDLFWTKADIPSIVKQYRDPATGDLSADAHHMALMDAMRRIKPHVAQHNAALHTILVDGLENSYQGGARKYWKAMPEGHPEARPGNAVKIAPDSLKERALAWANKQAAKLVTEIDETTREKIGKIVADGIRDGEGLEKTRRRLMNELAIDMPRDRARMIARTESCGAWNKGNLDRLKDRGIRYKTIVTHDPCEVCQAMKAAGPIPIDQPFPRTKGSPSKMTDDQYPPFHPRCYCSLVGAAAPRNQAAA